MGGGVSVSKREGIWVWGRYDGFWGMMGWMDGWMMERFPFLDGFDVTGSMS